MLQTIQKFIKRLSRFHFYFQSMFEFYSNLKDSPLEMNGIDTNFIILC